MRRVVAHPFPTNPELSNPKQLGDAVRAARTKTGLTLADAAMSLGVAKQTLADVEAGKPTVGLSMAMTIAIGLGVAFMMVPAEKREQAKIRLSGLLNEN